MKKETSDSKEEPRPTQEKGEDKAESTEKKYKSPAQQSDSVEPETKEESYYVTKMDI